MIKLINSLISDNRRVLILGFGREGRSTYRFLRNHFPMLLLRIADVNPDISNEAEILNDDRVELFLGDGYLDNLNNFDVIIKSPGVNIGNRDSKLIGKITSQTDLFLQFYSQQVIGVTGTKGKSTTVSLIRHFLISAGKKVLLIGNIGVPAFDMIDKIEKETIVVYELSAHQLEYLSSSPHIAVLLNVFPEHLDYFNSYNDYCRAKFNIYKFQKNDDCLIIHESLLKDQDLPESTGYGRVGKGNNKNRIIEFNDNSAKYKIQNSPLSGKHNLRNINAALLAVNEVGVRMEDAIISMESFKSLPHRLENIGEFDGIIFINDSISTVPESTIAAVEAINNVDTLILGGYDRGLNYTDMIEFLRTSSINNFIFLGKAGDRMFDDFGEENSKFLFKANSIESAFEIIVQKTAKGGVCLLSPAAASYDQFHNFEHRGDTFRALALKL